MNYFNTFIQVFRSPLTPRPPAALLQKQAEKSKRLLNSNMNSSQVDPTFTRKRMFSFMYMHNAQVYGQPN